MSKPTYLVYFDPNYCLYANVDASKVFGIGDVVYHVKDDGLEATTTDYNKTFVEGGPKPEYPKKSNIEPIIFLSCWLSLAEHCY